MPPRIEISGTVHDKNAQPIAGVNIIIKGTTNGTSSDANGNFVLDIEDNDVLIFSFIGFISQEVRINGQTKIDVVMNEETKNLNEVVVNVGYWEVKQKEQTGNVSRITSKEIEKQVVSNPLQAIQGRMAGVYVQQSTGMPGGGFKIQIRGQNSLRDGADGGVNGNLPLYLIDGVPFTSTSLSSLSISGSSLSGGNPLSSINPNDIESIEVLKDADATAIYGSRGANGVVLITTKRAKTGKSKLDLDVYQGIGQVANFMELLNSDQYLEMRHEAFKNDGDIPNSINAPDLLVWDTTRSTNWQKKLIGGTARVTNTNLTFSGGNEKTQFLLNGAYYKESTVFPGDNAFKRGSGRLTISHKSENNKLKIESTVNFSSSVSNIPSIDFTAQATTLAPTAPLLYDEDNNLNWESGTWNNPLAALARKYKGNIENLVTSAMLSYEIIDGLQIKSNLGFTTMNVKEVRTNPLSSFNPEELSGRTGSSTFGNSSIKTWIAEPQAVYNRNIGAGIFSALLGSTFQESIQAGNAIEGNGYTNDAFLENLSAATAVRVTEDSYSKYRYTAAFMRLNYTWNEKYILNLTGRRDGSSRFGSGNKFANFGALGAAWIFSNEPFIRNALPFLSFGKIRTSYGTTGSDAIGNYQYLETYSSTTYPYGNSGGLTLTRLANPNYSWETNKKFEIGMELTLFKNIISLSSSYYFNQSTGQLVGLPLPVVTGQSSVQFNLPATVQNKGLEFQLSTQNFNTKKFQWTTNFNLTIPTNTLTEFPNLENFPAYTARYDVGKSITTYKAYEYGGVDPQTGLYTFVDRNADNTISSPGDYVGIKKIAQTAFGGIGNSLSYQSFQLDFFLQFVNQSGFDARQSFAIPGLLSNQPAMVVQRWQQADDNASIQRFTSSDPTGEVSTAYYRNLSSNNIITDASFLRLKNASLSWQMPAKWMQKVKMNTARIYLQGQNLLTFTKYKGLDPETQSAQSLPPLRMITAGIQLSL